MSNIADSVRRHAAERPDKLALVCDDRSLTYAQLHDESSQVAHALAAEGVGSQDRVGFLAKNIAEYFTVSFGAAKLNAVVVAVNWRLAPPEIAFILDHAETDLIVVEPEFLEQVGEMDLPRAPKLVVVGADGGDTDYASWIAGQPTDDPNAPSGIDDTAVQLYTSGTTGLPKGAELSNRNIDTCLDGVTRTLGLTEDSVMLHMLPLFHIGGSGTALTGLNAGCTNVVHRDVDPARICADIPGYQVTHTFMVPALLQVMPMIPGAGQVDFSSLQTVSYGASPITEEVLVAAMSLLGCDFIQGYGATETTGVVTWLLPEDHDPGGPRAHLLRSAGKPVDTMEVRIVDTKGNDVADGKVGEIWVRSHQNLRAYWRNPEATAAAFPEGRDEVGFGWYATGDAGYLEEGYLYISDRVKDMIVSGGENVYPAEIENAIMAHPEVADVAVIGVPSERWGETPLALVVPMEGTTPSFASVRDHCAELIARFKLPTDMELVAELPRSPAGKILKVELRKPYWAGHERAVN